MGRSIQTCRIAKMTRYKRSASWRKITDSIKRDMISSPTGSPFDSMASLIRQRNQDQKEAGLPPIFGEVPELAQYGSNSKDVVIACCTFATSNHEQYCNYKSQADHPVIIGLSTQLAVVPNHANLHLESQAKLQVTDSPQPEGKVTHHWHHSSNHAASSTGTRKLYDLESAVHEKGLEVIKHRCSRSVTDEKFDVLLSNAATSAKALDEIVDEDLRINFCALGI